MSRIWIFIIFISLSVNAGLCLHDDIGDRFAISAVPIVLWHGMGGFSVCYLRCDCFRNISCFFTFCAFSISLFFFPSKLSLLGCLALRSHHENDGTTVAILTFHRDISLCIDIQLQIRYWSRILFCRNVLARLLLEKPFWAWMSHAQLSVSGCVYLHVPLSSCYHLKTNKNINIKFYGI